MPRVTVLMAVYNGESHVRQAIDSVLHQTYRDFELVIVNDASTDRSREIVLSYRDPRIRLLDNEHNLGLAKSLNRGLAAAVGEFVARQDADDISEPCRLERQVRFLDAHVELALVGTWYREIDAAGRLLRTHELPSDYTAIRWALLFFCPFVHSSIMLRRLLVLSQVGTYDESLDYSIDYELWTRIARSLPVANLEEYLVQLRTHPGSMTATFGDRAREGHRLRVARIGRMLGWAGRGVIDHDARFRAIDALYRGAVPELSLDRSLAAAADLLLLQRVFCEEAQLVDAACRAHRAVVLRRISWTLAGLARAERATSGISSALRLFLVATTLRLQAKWLDIRLHVSRLSPRRFRTKYRVAYGSQLSATDR